MGAGRRAVSAQERVAARRHVFRTFRDVGAHNVIWSWSPNVPFPGSVPLASLFPGDRWVDRVGLDGNDWAGFRPGTSWTRFADGMGEGVDSPASARAFRQGLRDYGAAGPEASAA